MSFWDKSEAGEAMRKKVLLVDDVKLFLRLEETFFKRTGCEIITAESGQQAISSARDNQPDLILLDYIMPDMMGDEVCKQLKTSESTRDIPIMIVSTSADSTDIDKCFEAGATDYVTKPINAKEILSKAASILEVPERVHYRVEVNMQVLGEASGNSFTGLSRNLSRGGVLVECENDLAEGTEVSLQLPLMPEQGTMSFKGKVVRNDVDQNSGKYLLGVKFTELTPEQKSTLSEFIVKAG
ncbi:MAG: response regulator [bacterium]